MIFDDNLADFATTEFEKIIPEQGQRGWLLETGRLPCMDMVGIHMNYREMTDHPIDDFGAFSDPFNIQYNRSDIRKKFSGFYGFSESVFIKKMEILTLGVRKHVELMLLGLKENEQNHYFPPNKVSLIDCSCVHYNL